MWDWKEMIFFWIFFLYRIWRQNSAEMFAEFVCEFIDAIRTYAQLNREALLSKCKMFISRNIYFCWHFYFVVDNYLSKCRTFLSTAPSPSCMRHVGNYMHIYSVYLHLQTMYNVQCINCMVYISRRQPSA